MTHYRQPSDSQRATAHSSLLGVPVIVQPSIGLPGLLATTLTLWLYRRLGRSRSAWLLALWGALCWYDADLTHTLGHIISARAAGAPMSVVRWGMLAQTCYDDHDVAPAQHIGRAIGGPVASALGAWLWWLVWRALPHGTLRDLAATAAALHGLVAIGSLVPLPMLDGGAIMVNLRKL